MARDCGLHVTDPSGGNDGPSSAAVGLPADLKIRQTLALGCPLVIEALWERLGLKKALQAIEKTAGVQVPYERALLAMVANRLCDPESKLGVWDRWLSTVHLPSCQNLKLRHMYEAMDLLHANIDEVEKTVFFNTANLFNLEVDLIFYDTTTASFHVDAEDDSDADANATLRKFGHGKEGGWAPQVVVALAVTREGVPVRSWVLPGNTADVGTVARVRADLRGWNLGRAMFVADSGMNSEDNRAELAKACGKYLLACRMASVSEVKRQIVAAAKYDGKWVIETNDDTISLEDAACGYKGLMVIERCFRSLKRTQIKLTPMYHWASRRIESHVKICVLALLIERIAEPACGRSWHHIQRAPDMLRITEFFDLKYRVLMRNELTQDAIKILKSLKIKVPPQVIQLTETA
jgi:hypothetical protein